MSLHALATDMASKGRNGDSMLVHMTPGEVHGLQALAMKHGGSLTTNPDTGLPEANFLKSILPILAGLALGPAGMGIAFGGLSSAASAGLLVGGVTGLATGSLSKGLMAGLGAYGGAGLGGGLSDLGAGELAQGQISANMPTLAEGASQAQIADYTKQVNDLRTAGLQGASQLPMADKLSAGFSSAMASPTDALAFAKQNMMPLGAAAAPIVADMMVPTTTKMAPVQSPGRIREKRWDGRQFVDVASTDAGVYNTSGRNFSDLYRGYNNGGIVALAEGGDIPGYADGMLVGDQDVFNYFKGLDQSKLASGALDAQIAADMQKYNVGAADIGRITGTQANQGDFEKRFVQAINPTTLNSADFLAKTADVGLTDQSLVNAMNNAGMSQSAQYAATHNLNDAAGIASAPKAAQDFYNTFGYKAGDLKGDTGGIAGLYTNINQVAGSLQDQINAGKISVEDAQRLSNAEMARLGINQADIKGATGKDLFNLFTPKPVVPPVVVPPVVPPVVLPPTLTNVITPTDLYTAPATSLAPGVSGNTGPSQIGGGTTINPNGTITTSPRIPGIPVGGFTGMTSLRDAYTKGGGSLGYTSPTYTPEEFTKKYVNRLSGDSKAAYDYLTGKAGAAYPTKSGVGQISEDYATAVLGYPARGNLPYIYNKATGKMDPNPDYVAPGRNAAGDVTYSMSLNDIKSSLKDTPLSGQALYDWAISNNLSAQQIADATGRSLSSVYSDFRAGSKAKTDADKKAADDKTAADAANNKMDDSSTGGEAAGGLQQAYAMGGATGYALGGLGTLGGYSDGGRLLKGPGDGVSDSIPATIGRKQQPARLADGEFVVPARIVSELGNGSTDAGAKKLYAMMDRVQRARGKTTGKNKIAANSRADKYLPA